MCVLAKVTQKLWFYVIIDFFSELIWKYVIEVLILPTQMNTATLVYEVLASAP